MREMPETATEIQTGLWMNLSTFVVGGTTYIQRELYSTEGYCFYDKTEEHYDEEGNKVEEILPHQRMYYQYMSLAKDKNIEDLVSVKIEDGYEIA